MTVGGKTASDALEQRASTGGASREASRSVERGGEDEGKGVQGDSDCKTGVWLVRWLYEW